jgi:sirohydrochlorin cobaltochelatase
LSIRYVLAAHGSSSADANDAVRSVAASLAMQLNAPVSASFLERCNPTILDALVESAGGRDLVVLIPFFLMPGMHVRRDLVEIVEAARAKTGGRIEIAEYLGAHESIPVLLAQIANQAAEKVTA